MGAIAADIVMGGDRVRFGGLDCIVDVDLVTSSSRSPKPEFDRPSGGGDMNGKAAEELAAFGGGSS